jgi:hypothetical protein
MCFFLADRDSYPNETFLHGLHRLAGRGSKGGIEKLYDASS